MKKILFCLICCCVFFLTACGDNFPYPYEEMKDKVISVEIIKIVNADSSNTTSEVVKTLNEEEIDEFLKALSETKLIYPFGDPPEQPYIFPEDHVFIIYYNNSNYEMLGRNATNSFNSKGKRFGGKNRRFTGNDFNDLLSKFIEIE